MRKIESAKIHWVGSSTGLARAGTSLGLVLLLWLAGCQAPDPEFSNVERGKGSAAAASSPANSGELVLHEGDTVRITFPGAPNLDAVETIRTDGMITLQLIGEFRAAGLTPKELQTRLLDLYGPQLQTKEVNVTVESSMFPVYVSGAVLRPGKIVSNRPLTALEAIMEAGGFDTTKANLRAVRIIRNQNGKTEHYTIDLKKVLSSQGSEQFSIRPYDIIFVPEKFSWF